jgi:hypothetical protein
VILALTWESAAIFGACAGAAFAVAFAVVSRFLR